MVKKVFSGQLFQISFALLFVVLYLDLFQGRSSGVRYALVLSIGISLLHQLYVACIWRIELYTRWISRNSKHGFQYYKIGFLILVVARMGLVVYVSLLDKGTLRWTPFLRWALLGLFITLCLYACYSVVRYFGLNRAFGDDHFLENAGRRPFVKKGIYRFTSNGMYLFAVLLVYIMPLVLDSKAGLYVALFNHAHLWVHYFCTEKPDMNFIYSNRRR